MEATRMETLSKIFRIRFTPSTISTLQQIAGKMDSTPSTVVRICVESALDPHSSRSKVALRQVRKAVKGKK